MRRIEMYEVQGKDTRVTITQARISVKVGRESIERDDQWDEILTQVLDATTDIPLDTRPLRGRLTEHGSLRLRARQNVGGVRKSIPYYNYYFSVDDQNGYSVWA